jgi:hypothetical protein
MLTWTDSNCQVRQLIPKLLGTPCAVRRYRLRNSEHHTRSRPPGSALHVTDFKCHKPSASSLGHATASLKSGGCFVYFKVSGTPRFPLVSASNFALPQPPNFALPHFKQHASLHQVTRLRKTSPRWPKSHELPDRDSSVLVDQVSRLLPFSSILIWVIGSFSQST